MRQLIIGNYTLTIDGELPLPNRPVLLCVGCAAGGVEEALAFAREEPCDVAACNQAIVEFPGALYLAASLHEDLLPGWVKARKVRNGRPCVVANDPHKGLDAVVAMDRACGSSGMYLALIGRAMGYRRIVLAGIRLERGGEAPYRGIWAAAKQKSALEGVESLSPGWLRELLRGRV